MVQCWVRLGSEGVRRVSEEVRRGSVEVRRVSEEVRHGSVLDEAWQDTNFTEFLAIPLVDF